MYNNQLGIVNSFISLNILKFLINIIVIHIYKVSYHSQYMYTICFEQIKIINVYIFFVLVSLSSPYLFAVLVDLKVKE